MPSSVTRRMRLALRARTRPGIWERTPAPKRSWTAEPGRVTGVFLSICIMELKRGIKSKILRNPIAPHIPERNRLRSRSLGALRKPLLKMFHEDALLVRGQLHGKMFDFIKCGWHSHARLIHA